MDTEQKISQLGLANSAAVLHPADTVMLSRTASVGYSVRIGRPMATTQAFVTWTPSDRLDARYLLLVLRAMQQEWGRLAYGSTHLTIYMPDLESIRIPLPPLQEQRRIADFLDAETLRIDSLTRIYTGSLRSLVRERLSASIDATVRGVMHRDQVPAAYVPLMSVPRAWPQARLRSLDCEIQTGPFGSQLHAADYVDGGHPIVNPANIVDGKLVADRHVTVDDTTRSRLVRHVLKEGDVVFGRRGELGRAAVVSRAEDGWLCGTGCLRIRFRNARFHAGYLRRLLGIPAIRHYFLSAAVGSTMANLNSRILFDMPILIPSFEEQVELSGECDDAERGARALMVAIERQLALLAERRQALITVAVTGQIDVTTARGVGVS